MLVLTRKVGEGIAIGDDVKIVVMQIKGKQVRLGIKASTSTAVHREEIYQRIKEENRVAAQSPDPAAVAHAGQVLGERRPQQATTGQVPIRRQVRGPRGDSEGGDGGL